MVGSPRPAVVGSTWMLVFPDGRSGVTSWCGRGEKTGGNRLALWACPVLTRGWAEQLQLQAAERVTPPNGATQCLAKIGWDNDYVIGLPNESRACRVLVLWMSSVSANGSRC